MGELGSILDSLQYELTITNSSIVEIAHSFQRHMSLGLAGGASSLKMLPSFLAKPTGTESGTYLALDFGGSNVRVLLVDLKGGLVRVVKKKIVPLTADDGTYDFTSGKTGAEQLFDFLVDNIIAMVKEDRPYFLGHTFSFPCRQHGLNQAELITWTKEIKTGGVEGHDINKLLAAALKRKGANNIVPICIINDTVGTLLAAAYTCADADIAAICGTGHNTCYLEQYSPLTGGTMIINMESGNFNALPYTRYDLRLDAASEKPGQQRLEKMVAGHYLGELVRLIFWEIAERQGDEIPVGLRAPYSLTGRDITEIMLGSSVILTQLTVPAQQCLQTICILVSRRSARLVAATFIGALLKIDPEIEHPHTIAVDGSLYEKMPGYSQALQQALAEGTGEKSGQIKVQLVKDGSGIGAAVAAAIAAGQM